MPAIEPLYAVAGLLVGLLVGMTGVGGGSLMTPLLVLVFGFHPATAVGTDLLYASATKVAGTGVHGLRGSVDWQVVRRLFTGSGPAALLTLGWLSLTHHSPADVDRTITVILGVALVLTGVATLFRHRVVALLTRAFAAASPGRVAGLTVVLGAILGALVTLTSVGAGALGMTALLVLYPQAPVSRLGGSDIAHAVPLTLIAGIGHWLHGSVDGALLLSLLIGSVPGVIAGSLIATRVSERLLTPVLAATLAIVGAKLLV